MNFSLWLRNNVTDKANAPLRKQIASYIPDGSHVLEIGCANGKLLVSLAGRINQGVGIDTNSTYIDYARHLAQENNHTNLRFINQNAVTLNKQLVGFSPDISIAILCLHEMDEASAVTVLKRMKSMSKQIIIADFDTPRSKIQKFFTELDEKLSGHYDRYRTYQNNGGLPALLAKAGLHISDRKTPKAPGIKIWIL